MRATRQIGTFRIAIWAAYAVVAAFLIWLMVDNWFLSAGEISDSFSRTVTQSWGSTDKGIVYQVDGTAANFTVDKGVGDIEVPEPNLIRSVYLSGVRLQDVDVRFRATTDKLPQGGGQMIYFVARRIKGETQYIGRLRIATDGTLRLQAARDIGGSVTLLGAESLVPNVDFKPDSFIWIRAQVAGSNPTMIRLKAWSGDAPEPSNWEYTALDASPPLQASGEIGLSAYLSKTAMNAPVVFKFDYLQVNSYDFQLVPNLGN